MTTAATSLLGLALPVTGELSGTWGDTVNNSITSLLDTAVAGTTTLSTDGDVTLSTTTLAANQARQAILLCSGARTALRTITAPAQSKIYTIINATTGGFSVKLVGVGPTTGLTIPNGASAVVAWNGSDFIEVGSATVGNLTVNGNLSVTGTTSLTGVATLTANPVLSAGTANGVAYLNGSKVVTTGSALTFDGTTLVSSRGASNGVAAQFGRSSGQSLYVYADTTSVYLGSDNGANTALQLNETSDYIAGWLGGSEQMRLTSTGLGIGTSSPGTKLEVTGDITGTWTTGATRFVGSQYLTGSSYQLGMKTTMDTRETQIFAKAADTGGYVTIATGTTPSERVRVDGSGNVGIGTSSPAAKLDVLGSSGDQIRVRTAGTEFYRFGRNSGTGFLDFYGSQTGYQGYTFGGVDGTWMTINSSGNLGLGVTPSAWSGLTSFSIASTGSNISSASNDNLFITSGAYYNGTNWLYKATSQAVSQYNQLGGAHKWYYAASGTAGNAITFTQAMTLDASGRLGVGATSPGENLTINSANSANARIGLQYNGSALTYFGSYSGIVGTGNATDTMLAATGVLAFGAGGTTERFRIDSSGNFYIEVAATTASAANMFLDTTTTPSGQVKRSTSALKYKQDIRDLEEYDIGTFRPVRYKSACDGDDQTVDHLGFIADWEDEAGHKELVSYGKDGEVEGFQYDRMTAILTKVVQQQNALIKELLGRVAALEAK